jgi:undecaprenyl-diphosphatase
VASAAALMPHSRSSVPRLASRHDRFRSTLAPLLFGFAAALLAWAFVQLGGEVVEGDTHGLDTFVLDATRALRLGHPWLAEAMRDLSGLGSSVVLGLFTIASVGYLALFSSRTLAALVAVSVVSGSLVVGVFKAVFGRARPDPALAELVVSGLSFPSGHASMSAIVFLTLAALVASTRPRRRERAYLLVCAALVTVLIGLSRVVLGVHWATDVLGGWAFGSAWAMAWLLIARRLSARHRHGPPRAGESTPDT